MLRHLFSAVPRERATQLFRELPRLLDERVDDTTETRYFHEQRESRAPLDERRDVIALRSDEQVSLPMAGHCTIVGFCGPLANRNGIGNATASLLVRRRRAGAAHPLL